MVWLGRLLVALGVALLAHAAYSIVECTGE